MIKLEKEWRYLGNLVLNRVRLTDGSKRSRDARSSTRHQVLVQVLLVTQEATRLDDLARQCHTDCRGERQFVRSRRYTRLYYSYVEGNLSASRYVRNSFPRSFVKQVSSSTPLLNFPECSKSFKFEPLSFQRSGYSSWILVCRYKHSWISYVCDQSEFSSYYQCYFAF